MTAAELEQSVENLRGGLAALFLQDEALRQEARDLLTAASQHRHDWTRDITGKPAPVEDIPAHTHPYTSLTGTPLKFPADTHTHDYATSGHTHSYAASGHTHGAPGTHTHAWIDITNPPATYAPSAHGHPGYAADSHTHDLSGYATSGHTHDLSGYALSSHTHAYALSSHSHAYAADSHTHAYAADSHSHAYASATHTHTVTDQRFTANDPLDSDHLHSVDSQTRTTSGPQ